VCGVWGERVRVEVGVVLEGTFGRGRTCGSSVSAAVTDDSGRGGFGVSGSKYSVGFSMLSIYFVSKKAFYNNCN
jgi:hypothetical protein